MSIALLKEVHQETRRLAIAGSVVSPGDFRLKKLIAPLEQAGAKAPVFAKVAESAKAVVDGKEATSAQALLELASLVSAILYTQGETGIDGPLEPIETTEINVSSSQTSARVLKPLLEALSSTGSGRLELIRDAYERGAFKDMRLVKPAINAIDDGYPEIADLIVDKVLPLYGRAILPGLRARFDIKGKAGHPRRLRLMNVLDPEGTREIVKQALETGSKEVKVAAIECLGADKEHLSFLLEQAGAKAQDVRQAAYIALARIDDDAAMAVLQKAIVGKDLDIAARAISDSSNPKLMDLIVGEVRKGVEELAKVKDKKETSTKLSRLQRLAMCLSGRTEAGVDKLVLDLFSRRDEIAKVKGDTASGSDLNSTIVHLMSQGSTNLKTNLAHAHALLPSEEIGHAFSAARRALSPTHVFEMFSPYFTAKVDDKKKQRDPAWAARESLINELGGNYSYYYRLRRNKSELESFDPRWLDLAIQLKHVGLMQRFGRPGHAEMNSALSETLAATMKSSKSLDDVHQIVGVLISVEHPNATDAFIDAFQKFHKKSTYAHYWFGQMIVDLPKDAVPKLETLLTTMGDREADAWLGYIQQLREKK